MDQKRSLHLGTVSNPRYTLSVIQCTRKIVAELQTVEMTRRPLKSAQEETEIKEGRK